MPAFTRRARIIGIAAVTAATAAAVLLPGSADASGLLCRVDRQAPVFRDSDNRWIYTIPGGHDMRVTKMRGPSGSLQIYGHGAGHTQDGWADSRNFTYCR